MEEGGNHKEVRGRAGHLCEAEQAVFRGEIPPSLGLLGMIDSSGGRGRAWHDAGREGAKGRQSPRGGARAWGQALMKGCFQSNGAGVRGDRCWHTAGRTDGLDGGRGRVLSAPHPDLSHCSRMPTFSTIDL